MAKRKRIDNTMAKRKRIDNTMAKRKRIDNTMAKRKRIDNTNPLSIYDSDYHFGIFKCFILD
jgi:hypothetical protein